MSDGIKIISAAETDLPAVANLAGLIWRQCYRGIISEEQIDYMLAKMYSLETLRDEIQSRSVRFELFFTGGVLAGFASFGPSETPDTFKLHKLYLHSDWHGRGFGSCLLRHCENEVRRLGASRLNLRVNKRNEKAIKAYLRNGFQIAEAIATGIGGGFVMDDYVMEKNLAPPAA